MQELGNHWKTQELYTDSSLKQQFGSQKTQNAKETRHQLVIHVSEHDTVYGITVSICMIVMCYQ